MKVNFFNEPTIVREDAIHISWKELSRHCIGFQVNTKTHRIDSAVMICKLEDICE